MGRTEKIQKLFTVIANLSTVEECQELFDDLCTYKEVEKMAERLYAAELLMEGKTYNQVIAETDISSATLSRVSRCVQYGKGYRQVLQK
jgi:TrpR-related protein YerC/YecD